ncbi:MAG: DUF1173 family protein [Pseudomonadota bacterium]
MTIRVEFDNRSFELLDVLEFPARYVRELERTRNTVGHAVCRCNTHAEPLRLVIRRYGSLYHLAGWPDDGMRHNAQLQCPFYKDGSKTSAITTSAQAAIRKTAGGLNVRLDVVFAPQSGDDTGGPGVDRTRGTPSGPSRQSASLLAFLRSLWGEAGLNVWPAGATTRNWGYCNTALVYAIGDGPINGRQADRVLHVMRRFEAAQANVINDELKAFIEDLGAQEASPSRRGLIIGEINKIEPSKHGQAIVLRQNSRRYYVDSRLVERAARSYRFAWGAIGNTQARIVTLLVIEERNGYARVVDLCAMLCSAAFLPCDSLLEVAMANRLTKESRAFEKPLSANADQILADFILTDTSQRVEIEVYGLNGQAEYETRKREKQVIRASRGVLCVEWNADREPLDAVRLPSAI